MRFTVKLQPILVNTNMDCIWINIPKNASSFMQTMFEQNGWKEPDPRIVISLLESDIRKFAILRNPLKRWISGFAECFMDMPEMLELLDNSTFIEVIKRSPVFDNHTELQSAFITNSRNLEFIMLDSDWDAPYFFNTVDTWFKRNGYRSDCGGWRDKVNPLSEDPIKKKINVKLRKMQQVNKKLFEQIDVFFEPDYQLINSATRINYEL